MTYPNLNHVHMKPGPYGLHVVSGEFDASAARVIANALERDGYEYEAADWRKAAEDADGAAP